MRVLLVRHAEPVASPGVDPSRWPLSDAGRHAAIQLRKRLPRASRWVASTERKAYETVQCAGYPGVAVSQDSRFGEVRRDEPFDDDFKARRFAWLEGRLDARHSGWESAEAAAERFEYAVRDHSFDTECLVVGTHGMLLTAWLVHACRQLQQSEAGAFWDRLTFPDIVLVARDPTAGRVPL
jgi:broad specificity phosphatase PhoE